MSQNNPKTYKFYEYLKTIRDIVLIKEISFLSTHRRSIKIKQVK